MTNSTFFDLALTLNDERIDILLDLSTWMSCLSDRISTSESTGVDYQELIDEWDSLENAITATGFTFDEVEFIAYD